MKPTARFFVLIFACTISFFLVLPQALHAQPFNAIVAFGNSLTDFGGIAVYVDELPSTEDLPLIQTDDFVQTNGDVWVESLAQAWGADLDNNAIGGAETDRHTSDQLQELSDEGLIPDLGFLGQVEQFEGNTFAEDDTLFVVWIGGNDFLGFDFGQDDPDQFVNETVENIRTGLNDLAVEVGARNFLVLNLPDMGQIPEFNDDSDVAEQATALARDFNARFDDILIEFQLSHDAIRVFRFDIFAYLNAVIASGTFENTTGTFLELDADGDWTGDFNGPADEFIFWDEIHPTDRVHDMLGQEAALLTDSEFIELASDLEQDAAADGTGNAAGGGDDDGDDTCFISIIRAR